MSICLNMNKTSNNYLKINKFKLIYLTITIKKL